MRRRVKDFEIGPIELLRWTMSVHSVENSGAVAQTEAVSQAQSAQKKAIQNSAIPEDRVTISAASQAKQTASSIGADLGESSGLK
jgi:hypothetical protein